LRLIQMFLKMKLIKRRGLKLMSLMSLLFRASAELESTMLASFFALALEKLKLINVRHVFVELRVRVCLLVRWIHPQRLILSRLVEC